MLHGTFWLAVKTPLQIVVSFWSVPLVQASIGRQANGAYVFAWGFGFVQLLLEFGMNSALQREMTAAWTRQDRERVNRLIACGMSFYLAVALAQMAVLIAIAYWGLPPKFQGELRRLIVGMLWIQALSAPLFGLITVTSSVLQAARHYEYLPRLDLLVLLLRFAILVAGLRLGVDFVRIVALQTVVHVVVTLLPTLRVMVGELGFIPHFRGARGADFGVLLRVGFYMFLMQLSVVFADRLDTTILGYALPDADPGPSITIYQNISKPFLQIRQLGWTLAYLVLPAVASLEAAGDRQGLERMKYDAPRLMIGLLFPLTLLAGIYAAPFLELWVGARYVPYAPWLQLFLIGTLPLALSVHSQMALGLGKMRVVAISPLLGSLVNLPLSYYLTLRLGVVGVIWGTVLTTLISNLLIPGIYLFKVLDIRVSTYIQRTLAPPLMGATVLVATAWLGSQVIPTPSSSSTKLVRLLLLLSNLGLGVVAYAGGYLATSVGRQDVAALLLRKRASRQKPRNENSPPPTEV